MLRVALSALCEHCQRNFVTILDIFLMIFRRTKVGSDVPVVVADDPPASVHR